MDLGQSFSTILKIKKKDSPSQIKGNVLLKCKKGKLVRMLPLSKTKLAGLGHAGFTAPLFAGLFVIFSRLQDF